MADKYFIKYIDVKEPVETIFGWHEKQGAFERLTPPWMRLKNIHKTGNGIKTGARVNMDICFAGIPVPMRAEHTGYAKNKFFRDRLHGGPFSKWEHTHTFYSPADNEIPSTANRNLSSTSSNTLTSGNTLKTPDNTIGFSPHIAISRLEDRIDYALPFHIPDKWHEFIKAELYRLFNYRHTVMVTDLERHRNHELRKNQMDSNDAHTTSLKPLSVLISGASGPVGKALIPFLTTGGHRVIKLVRNTPSIKHDPENGERSSKEISNITDKPVLKAVNEIKWDPYTGMLDLEPAGKIDVVINLNGYHIGSGRWTDQRKDIIIKSRNLSTTLLADRIALLPSDLRPELFISASATGFYGDCGDECLNENSCSGNLFISQVCQEWENCAIKAQEAGIRTVFARMGVVLTPAGGALERLLPGFMMGLGAKIGSGEQYMSWISMDDLVYALHHIIMNNSIHGAVNIISPNPVTNSVFTQTLGKVLSRPARFTLPASLIRMVWGEMGHEVLLASTRVTPERLINSGFKFSHPSLEQALCHLLGKIGND
ncbi:MAG: TIGR01777 family protein [Desulfamplus sp.]|nr:TIGR01777 family protein [Desulfamplus sp.]